MSRLFKLKEWVTLPEAAKRLAITLGEEVTESDLLRLALDNRLRLSVNFVNYAYAKLGTVGDPEKARYLDIPNDLLAAVKAKTPDEYKGGYTKTRMGVRLKGGEVIDMEKGIFELNGVYDLPMIGGEGLDIEHRFQMLTGGPAVELESMDGAFVKSGEFYLQLQEDYENNEYMHGSLAYFNKLKVSFSKHEVSIPGLKKPTEDQKRERENFLEVRKSNPKEKRYFPACGLPKDSVLVVRTDALIDFEQSLQGKSGNLEKSLSTKERNTLLTTIGVLLELIQSPKPGRDSEAVVIEEMLQNYDEKPGISKRTLEQKFAEAKKILRSS